MGDRNAYTITEPSSDTQWQQYYNLRWRILRKPWGQPAGSERDDREHDAVHRVAVTPDGEVIACGRLHMNTDNEAQVRYMAVDDAWQGRGIGAAILNELERAAAAIGAHTVVLNARESAIGFYEKCGYRIVGDGPTAFGSIRHNRMSKTPSHGDQQSRSL